MMGRVKVKRGASGKGVRLVKERRSYDDEMTMSFHDAAELLFALKDFLQADVVGRGSLDSVAAERRRRFIAEAAERRRQEEAESHAA